MISPVAKGIEVEISTLVDIDKVYTTTKVRFLGFYSRILLLLRYISNYYEGKGNKQYPLTIYLNLYPLV